MNDQRVLLKSYLKTLKLPTIQREYQAIARASAKSNEPYESYLQRLAEMEVQHRQIQAIARRLKQANFPMAKELEGVALSPFHGSIKNRSLTHHVTVVEIIAESWRLNQSLEKKQKKEGQ